MAKVPLNYTFNKESKDVIIIIKNKIYIVLHISFLMNIVIKLSKKLILVIQWDAITTSKSKKKSR